MTTAFTQTAFSKSRDNARLPTLPTGWPIGSYESYVEARQAVDHLAHNDFPVSEVTIVGVEPMLVERVAGKLSWGRVLGTAAMSGAWFGFFVGLLFSMISTGPAAMTMLIGLVSGIGFSTVFAAISYGTSRGRRDFVSTSQLVARRYDVLSQPRNAERGRELLANLAAKTAMVN